MALNQRERILLGATITVVVVGVTYLLAAPLWRRWQTVGAKLKTQRKEHDAMVAYNAKQPEWQRAYDQLRQQLGQSEQKFTQTSDVLKKIEEVGGAAGILINARRPMPVVDKGVYRELPVQCAFEADTAALVKFLHGLQTASGFVSVEQLTVAPRADNPSILRCDIQIRALAGKTEGS
jgi:Tfp pilus assembly protein PilO